MWTRTICVFRKTGTLQSEVVRFLWCSMSTPKNVAQDHHVRWPAFLRLLTWSFLAMIISMKRARFPRSSWTEFVFPKQDTSLTTEIVEIVWMCDAFSSVSFCTRYFLRKSYLSAKASRQFTPNDPTVNLQILKCILVKSHFQAHFGKLLHDVLRALVLCDLSLVIEENHVCLVNVALEPQRCFNAILLLCILQLVAVHAHHKMYLTLCVILSHLVKSWNGCTSENLVPQSVKNATCLKWLMCMHVACIDNKWKAKYICDRHTKKCTVYICIVSLHHIRTCTSEHLKSSSIHFEVNATLLAARDIVNVQLRLFVFTARHVALQEPESWSS